MNDLEMSELIHNKYEKLLTTYTQVMYLKIFIDSNDDNIKELYNNAAKKNNYELFLLTIIYFLSIFHTNICCYDEYEYDSFYCHHHHHLFHV